MSKLDEIDLRIINELQSNGRLSNIEIAERVGLSHSACSRRITKLEKEEVILGYRAIVDRNKLGLSVRVYCGIVRDSSTSWDELAKNLANIDGVVSVFGISGDVDLMIEVIAKDMQYYSEIIMSKVFNTKGVSATRSSFVLAEVKSVC